MSDKHNKLIQIGKYILLLCSMYICVLFGTLCYSAGFCTHILITLISVLMTYIGYKFTHMIVDILFLYVNLLLSTYIGSKYATMLYYENISSDDMSLVVGNIFMSISLLSTLFFIILFSTIRIIKVIKANQHK